MQANFSFLHSSETWEGEPLQGESMDYLNSAENTERVVSAFIPLKNTSFRLRGMSIMRNIYSSTVKIPSYYTEHKHEEYGTWKYAFRKASCIPFAFLYGFVLVWIISDVILNKPEGRLKMNSITQKETPRNICAYILSVEVNTTIMGVSNLLEKQENHSRFNLYNSYGNNASITPSRQIKDEPNVSLSTSTFTNITGKDKDSILFENDSPELYYATGTFMGIIGITSILSRNTRGVMLLILPGLVTRHSRKVIFTIILGVLANGPMNSFRYNFNKVLDNTACMYETVTIAACIKQKETNLMLKYAKSLYDTLEKMYDLMNHFNCYDKRNHLGQPCRKVTQSPFYYLHTTWQNLKSMTAPSWSVMKLQASTVIEKLNIVGYYIDIARKCLTVVSIMLLIFDSVCYLRSYYTDSSFDNTFIDISTRKFWKDKNYQSLTPLRHWEINEGYKVLNLSKFTKKELYKILRNSLFTFLFFIFVAVVFITDHLLAGALQYIKDNHEFSIPLTDMNLTDHVIKLHNYNMKSCLSSPRYTSKKVYWVSSLLLLAAAISCALEVYMSRIRANMCNLFYPDRAEERADYLYYKITSGRINRRYHLLLIIRREIERKIRLVRFSPLKRLTKCLFRTCTHRRHRNIICPGCGWKVKWSKCKDMSFTVVEKKVNAKICQDCDLDLFGGNKIADNMYESNF